ncbi:hypothetical protein EG829_12905 [bacterium]|nr:hypothetical protein [bacterium]
MKSAQAALLSLVAGASMVLMSCSSGTQITKSWADDNFSAKPFKRILVVAVAKDSWVQGAFETTLMDELAGRDVEVIRSMDVMEEKQKLTEEIFVKLVAEQKLDAVLITREIDRTEKDKLSYSLPPSYYGMYSYYNVAYSFTTSPAYVSQTEVFRIETNLYETKTTRLVWSAVSESESPKKASDIVKPLTGMVAKTLVSEGFVR